MTLTVQPSILVPNFVDATFVDAASGYEEVVFSGGLWLSSRPLTLLLTDFLNETARTSSASTPATFLHVDLGSQRDVSGIAIPKSNISRSGSVRVRAATTPNWDGVTVNGVNAENATSLSVTTTGAIAVLKGDGFTIQNDDAVYQATADVSIGAATTGLIGVTRISDDGTGLAAATTGGEEVTCHAGDFTGTPELDTGYIDVWQEIYAWGRLPFGHPSFTDGKASPEEAAQEIIPFAYYPGLTLARYWRIDIRDTSNPAGYVEFPRLFIGRSREPSMGMPYGTALDLFSDSTVKKSKGSARRVNESRTGRRFPLTFPELPEDEAMELWNDLKNLGLRQQVFVAFNKSDTIHLHRRSIIATLEKVESPTAFTNWGRCSVTAYFQEVLA